MENRKDKASNGELSIQEPTLKQSRAQKRDLERREEEAKTIIKALCDKILILYKVNPDNLSQSDLEAKIKDIIIGWRVICKRKSYTSKAYPIINDFYKSLIEDKQKLSAE